jgi:2-oxo-4-hydroxy-4-carboxy-5-ureidoimidazoline decarboxylase
MRLQGASADRGSLAWWNHLDEERAAEELRACCAAEAWVEGVLTARPYASPTDLLATSDALVRSLDDAGLAQALAAHGRIGERPAGETREAAWSREEQAAALGAGADVHALLREGNRAYEQRFGRVFLIRAAGRSPEEMYAALQDRLDHDDQTERGVVLDELAQIVHLRLERLVGP